MKIKTLYCCLFLAYICHSGIASAGTITLAPIDVGKFDTQNNSNDYTTTTNHYTSLSSLYNNLNYYGNSNRGYAIYDLSGIQGVVSSASVLLHMTYNPFVYYPEGAMYVYAALSSQSATTLLSLPAGEFSAGTLLNGPVVGQQASGAGQGVGQEFYEISLNQSALNVIAGGGLLTLSFVHNWWDTDEQAVSFTAAPQLQLTDDTADVPLTDTLSLVVLAGLALVAVSRQKPQRTPALS